MDKALIDTDILSEILKGKNAHVAARANEYTRTVGALSVSVVTMMEVVKGLQKVQRKDVINRFLQAAYELDIITFDGECAVLAGRIYGDLEREGQPIGRADPMIAATAIYHELTLVTGNTRHFKRIADLGYPLPLHDWREEP